MEELLKSVDFAIDFDMDTSDLDCLDEFSSDDLLDLNEDELLNIDLLTCSEYEDLEECPELNDDTIDSFFVQDQLNSEEDYKCMSNILTNLKCTKELTMNNSPINSNSSISTSINNLFLIKSTNNLLNNSITSNQSTNLLNNSINAHSSNYSSNVTALNYTSSTYRSQNQRLIKENSDDSYCSSDDDSISSIPNLDETSQIKDEMSIELNRNQTRRHSNCKAVSKNQSKNQIKNSLKNQFKSKPERKLSKTKGTSLLVKPKTKNLKKVKKEMNDNFRQFFKYFYLEHNYCSM